MITYKNLKILFKNKSYEYIKSYCDLLCYDIPIHKEARHYAHKLKKILTYYAIIEKGERIKARTLKDYTTK